MRYQIWDKTSSIITPSGDQFTAEQWANMYPWIQLPGAKMIITAGLINGGAAMEYEATVEIYKKQGCPITDDMTDRDVLDAIENFEDNPPQPLEPSTEERIAAALEAQVMMAEPDSEIATVSTFSLDADPGQEMTVSPAFLRVLNNFRKGLWSQTMVGLAAQKGHITVEEAAGIISST